MDISAAGFQPLCPAIVVTIRVGERVRYPQKYQKGRALYLRLR
jgi:hypothetical protein